MSRIQWASKTKASLLAAPIILLLTFMQANADTLTQITQTLDIPDFSGGSFQQTRTLEGFKHPLKSTGRYFYWNDQGLYWETSTPFFRASTFSPAQIISWSAPGTISATEKPSLVQREINKVLTALLSGDIEALEKVFSVEASITNNTPLAWETQLTPKSPTTKKVIAALSLSGDRALRSLTIQSANGDTTLIQFDGIISQAQPNTSQCALFHPNNTTDRCNALTP